MQKDKFSVTVRINNITLAQSIALEDMFATWQQLGGLGCSRWTSFFADGDGNFRPKIFYNGRKAQRTDLLTKEELWEGDKYRIDFDSIAWKLHSAPEKAKEAQKQLTTHAAQKFCSRLWKWIVGKTFGRA